MVKDFTDVTEDPHKFANKSNIVIQTHQPSFPDLYQPVHMIFSEGQAPHWINTGNWDNPERSLKLQMGYYFPALSDDQVCAIAKQHYQAIPWTVPKTIK